MVEEVVIEEVDEVLVEEDEVVERLVKEEEVVDDEMVLEVEVVGLL